MVHVASITFYTGMLDLSMNAIQNILKLDPVVFNAMVLAAVNGIGVMYIKKINPNKDADRYYHQSEPYKYLIFNLAYTILLLSLAIHVRFVLGHCLSNVFTWLKKQAM